MASKLKKESFVKKSALVIGQFMKNEHVFTGKIESLAISKTITLQPNGDKERLPSRLHRPSRSRRIGVGVGTQR